MKNTPYNPLDIASLHAWQQGGQADNSQQLQRLLTNLPLAVERELTPRQRQILSMRFSRAMERLLRALQYSL